MTSILKACAARLAVMIAGLFITLNLIDFNNAQAIAFASLATEREEASESLPAGSSAAALPSNIQMHESLKPFLERILRKSPTFRHQCIKIAATRHARIEIKFKVPEGQSNYRALTKVNRFTHGFLKFSMMIPAPIRPESLVEVIGHEFEHVLEQIEGVNLKALSSERSSGVEMLEGGVFESLRAVKAGLTVLREYKRNHDV